MSIDNSILKEILINKNCSFGKYLTLMYCGNINDIENEFYLTPLVTASRKDVIIISKVIKGNWEEALRNIGSIFNFVKKTYRLNLDKYILIFHSYFDEVQLENFYLTDSENEYSLKKLILNEFEKILD